MKGMNKDYAQLVKKAKKQGWTVVYGKGQGAKGHPRLVPPDGGQFIVIPLTPSDHRSFLNTRAELRRAGLKV